MNTRLILHRAQPSLCHVQPAFATALRRRREALDLSQEALARRAGISTVFVGRVESTRNQPTINSMQKLAKGLDARLSDLIREAEALAKR